MRTTLSRPSAWPARLAYNSPVCDLAVRPITDPSDPNYFNPAVNMPTEVRSAPVNAALQKIKGYDLQLDYNWDIGRRQSLPSPPGHLSAGQFNAHHAGFDVLYLGGAAPLMQTTFLHIREQQLERRVAEPLAGQHQSQEQRQ